MDRPEMGFDFGQTLNSASDRICSSKLVGGIVSNPIITALLITALAVIVLFVLFTKDLKKCGRSDWKKTVRFALLILVASSSLLFVHYYAARRTVRNEIIQKDVRDVFNAVQNATPGGVRPIIGAGQISRPKPAIPLAIPPASIYRKLPAPVSGPTVSESFSEQRDNLEDGDDLDLSDFDIRLPAKPKIPAGDFLRSEKNPARPAPS